MGAGVDVAVDTTELEKKLAGWRKRTADLTPVMAVIAEHLVAAVNDQFESAGDGKWAPLAPSTLKKRRKEGRGAQVLKDTGRFAASIRADAGPDFAEASTDVGYAVYHVSEAPRALIPLRNPFDLPDEVLDEATDILVAELLRGA